METIGIICEYSPFHNGHIYHLKKIKEKYPSSTIILCLNGYFLERGQISLISKEDKTKIALEYGVDIVIELPVVYGSQSADKFAYASTFLLNAIGVTKIIFGSESNNIPYLENLALRQLEKNFQFINQKAYSYPKNLNQSLNEKNIISPNDLLAISYIKEIKKNAFNLSYETIKRTSDFHDTKSTAHIISASNIRKKIELKEDITPYLPNISKKAIKEINKEKLFMLLKYNVLINQDLSKYIDVKEGLEFKLLKEIKNCQSYTELHHSLKSKRYTYNRIQRMLCHILLGILKENANTPITYIHILGFSKKGQKYLKENRKNIKLPTKPDNNSKLYYYETLASQIYDLLTESNTYEFERKNQPVTIGSNESNQK